MSSNQRFNCSDQKQPSWLDRALLATGLIGQACQALDRPARLADIGCGDMKLAQLCRQANLAIDYIPLDIAPQSNEVSPFDVQKDSFPDNLDVAVLLGVVEYLSELAQALNQLHANSRYLVVSHVVRELSQHDKNKVAQLGWCNHLSSDEFLSLCESAGWQQIDRLTTQNNRTRLWLFARTEPAVNDSD